MQSACSSDIKLRSSALLVQLMDMRTTSDIENISELPENCNYHHQQQQLHCIRPSLGPIQPLVSGYGKFISRDKGARA